MRINKTDNIFQAYKNNNNVKKVKLDKGIQEKDRLEISPRAVEFQHAMEKLKNVDEMRKDKVDKIKKQIDAGTYEIDEGKIAEKILESIDFDQKI